MPQNKIHEKVVYYLFNGVLKTLLKKQIDKFDSFDNSPFTMSFNYPEAAALYNELSRVKTTYDFYLDTTCLSIRNQIHKELI